MFVFEEIDGTEVCFFGLHVQEYGSDCQAPNTRRVYISYLDSIHFFHPKHLRTLVYHEILIGYLQFCKNNGLVYINQCPDWRGSLLCTSISVLIGGAPSCVHQSVS